MDLYFLTLDDVLEIHKDQIDRYGGKTGIRDQNLLLSALAQPYSAFEGRFLHKTIFDKAAAYLFHICQNHPFIDGNKRVGAVSALLFLSMNDYSIDFKGDALEKLVRTVAQGKSKKADIAAFFNKNLK